MEAWTEIPREIWAEKKNRENTTKFQNADLVKIWVPPTLLLLWSKITVDLVKNPDLVKILVPPKNFTKSALYCIRLLIKGGENTVPLSIWLILLTQKRKFART